MIEKFNGIIYLVVFIIHFIGYGVYAYQMIINNKKFRAKFDNGRNSNTYNANDRCFVSWSIINGSLHYVH